MDDHDGADRWRAGARRRAGLTTAIAGPGRAGAGEVPQDLSGTCNYDRSYVNGPWSGLGVLTGVSCSTSMSALALFAHIHLPLALFVQTTGLLRLDGSESYPDTGACAT